MAAKTSIQQSNPFIKQLASSDRRIRDRALSSLRTFLHRSTPISPTECLKLWKGLYFCMWMSDKPRTQQQLARDLADLLHVCTPENFVNFADAFWKTMARDWNNIDALRMDKFLYLVRCYVQEGFQFLRKKRWEEKLVTEYVEVLEGVALNVRDGKIPNGLRYHVIDIYVDELDKADEKDDAPLEELLKPMRKLGKESPVKAVKKKVAEALEDERLSNWKRRREVADEEVEDGEDVDASEGEDGEFGGFDD